MGKIERVTMFKIPKAEDRQELVKRYETLSKTAVKVSEGLATSPVYDVYCPYFILPLVLILRMPSLKENLHSRTENHT